MKKKIVLLIMLVVLVISPLMADVEGFEPFDGNRVSFRPTSARIEGMGGAGLAIVKGNDTLFYNPANLAYKGLSINLPSVSLTVHNLSHMVRNGVFESLLEGNMEDVIGPMVNSVGYGRGEIITTDISTSITGGGLGFGLHIQEQLHTQNSGMNALNAKYFAELNIAAVFGLGVRIHAIPDYLSVDVGATAKLAYKAYTKGFSISTIAGDIFEPDGGDEFDPMELLNIMTIASGVGFPIDIGVNVNLPFGMKVSAVARDVIGTYKMTAYENSLDWVNDSLDIIGVDKPFSDSEVGSNTARVEFPLEIKPKFDVGFGYVPRLGKLGKVLQPSIALDLVDIGDMIEASDYSQHAFLTHLNVGAELRVASTLDLRFGMNAGYMSVGMGLDLFVIRLDAAYYWREYGNNIGDNPKDAFTLRFNIGYDR